MYRASVGSLIIIVCLCTCTVKDEGGAPHVFHIDTENGVTVAENAGAPKYDKPLFELVEKVRLEQDENRPESLLTRVSDYRLADDGRYYVLDRSTSRLVVYDEQGRFLHTIGRQGQGPGEFEYPRLRWIRDGNLVIYDSVLHRLSLWRTDGTLVRLFPYPTIHTGIADLNLTPDQLLVVKTRATERHASEPSTVTFASLIMTPDGDTLAIGPSASNDQPAPLQTASGVILMRVGRSRYYGPQADIEYHPDLGILGHDSAHPELRWYDLTGNLRRIIRLALEREPVTEEDRRQVFRHLQEVIETAPNPVARENTEAQKEHAEFAEYKAFWDDVYVDDLAYIWLEDLYQYPMMAERTGLRGYRILNPAGEYIGRTELPDSKVSICQGCVLTIQGNEETGETDFIVYTLRPLVRGLRYP